MFKFLNKHKAEGDGKGPTEAETLEHALEASNHRPVASFDVVCASDSDLQLTIERRGDAANGAWMVSKSDQVEVPEGCQVMLVNGVPIPDSSETSFFALDCFLGWPSRLTFVLPPYKKGPIFKKSKTAWEHWNERVLEVRGGRLRYWDVNEPQRQKGHFDMQHAKISWTQTKERAICLDIAFGEEHVVAALTSELERFEWAVALLAATQMATAGLSALHRNEVQVAADVDSKGDANALGDHFHAEIPF
ncbi:Aste57867_11382 [Aphanomyces stellatus]|uniref:Aste57867_11382 protein n=1 Tax=Aphanomyces stellatus TaxID=120398 RepID=A0A485KTZ4_9STRA|nr:hypothetical protein As57867_011340 [Aphanomyces stellatus]VFT88243.1 Aste57867_11382 [Aphanomyces stellatus]